MRRLRYPLVAMLLLGRLETASACSDPNRTTDEELFAKASTVFVARIYRTEEIEVPGVGGARAKLAVEGAFRLEEVLKGQPPVDGKFKAPPIFLSPLVSMCGTPLVAGFDYVVFLDSNNFMIQVLDKGTRLLLELSPGIEDKLCVSKECHVGKLRKLAKRML